MWNICIGCVLNEPKACIAICLTYSKQTKIMHILETYIGMLKTLMYKKLNERYVWWIDGLNTPLEGKKGNQMT